MTGTRNRERARDILIIASNAGNVRTGVGCAGGELIQNARSRCSYGTLRLSMSREK